MRFVFASIVAVLAMILMINTNGAQEKGKDDKKPKYTIKMVMQKAMKGGLCKKVATGEATDKEKKQLVEYFTALSQNTPPKGDEDSWKAKTSALIKAAKADDEKALKKAANCGACHSVHKK